jgi:hypothetical protein
LRDADDPIYNFPAKGKAVEIKGLTKEEPKKLSEGQEKDIQDAMKTFVAHPESLTVKVDYDGATVFTLNEGKVPSGYTSDTGKESPTIDASFITSFSAAVKDFTDTNERAAKLVKDIATVAKLGFDDWTSHGKKTGHDEKEHKSAAAGFRQLFKKSKAVMIEEKSHVGVHPVRWDVAIYSGIAFYILWPGEHSASIIYKVNTANGFIMHMIFNGNHGRQWNDAGIAFKCMHTGATIVQSTDPDPAAWDCTTPYFAAFCFRGPNHNCNANAMFQIQVSDAPLVAHATNAGICARACPIRSAAC